ncbi:MAG TPA: Stf0 family sulfotransferase [Candidatus Bathyarchaeia archaeon]|nr:Stf0 family sulfotransferase [Candidatus Bathyarchaeia archaeon]
MIGQAIDMAGTTKNFLGCSTPRTGSSLLCHLLKETNIAGMRTRGFPTAQEFVLKSMLDRKTLSFSDSSDVKAFLVRLFDVTRTKNGVGGFKMMWEQLAYVYEQAQGFLGGSCVYDLHRFFPPGIRYIWLIRKDELRQAVSWAKAIQTDAWDCHQQLKYKGSYRFDFYRIRNLLYMIRERNRQWALFFEHNHIQPWIISYEELIGDLLGTVRLIFDYLDVDYSPKMNIQNSYFSRQSDWVNDRWVMKFRWYQRMLTAGRMLGVHRIVHRGCKRRG